MLTTNSGYRGARRHRRAVILSTALLIMAGAMAVHSGRGNAAADSPQTATPIKHLIVVIGENRSFDHVYATYVPKTGHSILNLLSEGIVLPDGSPGRHFAAVRQFTTSGPVGKRSLEGGHPPGSFSITGRQTGLRHSRQF